MMYKELYQYLLQNSHLQLPGIGTFLINRKSATSNFPEKQIDPPTYSIVMQTGSNSPSKQFYNWLGIALNISDRDAVVRFNDFAFELKKSITEGGIINWNGVGVLSKGIGEEVKFLPYKFHLKEDSVSARKIIREKADHMVRVGEDHKTSAEMVDMLNKQANKKMYWWAVSLIAGLLATLFIGWYFSENGLKTTAVSNRSFLTPGEPPAATYKIVP